MKKLVLALLLAIAFINADESEEFIEFKNPKQFKQDCQNKISHFYSCRFLSLNLWKNLRNDAQKVSYYVSKIEILTLDMIHNEKIKNYLTKKNLELLNEYMKILSRDENAMNEFTNRPEKFYQATVNMFNEN